MSTLQEAIEWAQAELDKLEAIHYPKPWQIDNYNKLKSLLDAARDFETAGAEVLRLRKTIGRAYNCFHTPGKGAVECQIILERAVERGDSIDEVSAETVAQRTVEGCIVALKDHGFGGDDGWQDHAIKVIRSLAALERMCEWSLDPSGAFLLSSCKHVQIRASQLDQWLALMQTDSDIHCPGCGARIELRSE